MVKNEFGEFGLLLGFSEWVLYKIYKRLKVTDLEMLIKSPEYVFPNQFRGIIFA